MITLADHDVRMQRALRSLEGLSVGHALGEQLLAHPATALGRLERREVLGGMWPYRGRDWRQAALAAFGGKGSMGNGGAMRAAPIGAYFAGDLVAAAAEARLSAEVTHAHLEGQAGAVAAAAAWVAARPSETAGLFGRCARRRAQGRDARRDREGRRPQRRYGRLWRRQPCRPRIACPRAGYRAVRAVVRVSRGIPEEWRQHRQPLRPC